MTTFWSSSQLVRPMTLGREERGERRLGWLERERRSLVSEDLHMCDGGSEGIRWSRCEIRFFLLAGYMALANVTSWSEKGG